MKKGQYKQFTFWFQWILIFFLFVFVIGFTFVMFNSGAAEWIGGRLDLVYNNGVVRKNEILRFLGIAMGGMLIALQALASHRRAKAMEDSSLNIEKGQRQERLKNAIEHLGHNSDSVRLGGAYELFHLTEDNRELNQTVLDILCAHVRQTTSEEKYQHDYPSKPSEEIQSLLTLLFVRDHRVFSGCYINLQASWLNGANLEYARLTNADLSRVYLEKANLEKTKMQASNLTNAKLKGAYFSEAKMQGAYFYGAEMQGARLIKAQMQAARFWGTEMQRVIFSNTQMQGAPYIGISDNKTNKTFKSIIEESVGKEADLSLITFDDTVGTGIIPDSIITEPYTEKDAKQWIDEYNDDMSDVPKKR